MFCIKVIVILTIFVHSAFLAAAPEPSSRESASPAAPQVASATDSKVTAADIISEESTREETSLVQAVSNEPQPPARKLWTIQNALQYYKAHESKLMVYQIDTVYSMKENFGIELFIPIYLKNQFKTIKSRGLGDVIVNFQWTPWKDDTHSFMIVPGIKFPSGNINKSPSTGTGTYDFSALFSMTHFSNKWRFTGLGAGLFTTRYKGYKVGNAFNYEFIFGRLTRLSDNLQFSINGEMLGIYLMKDRFFGTIVNNTGGHTLYLGPLFSLQYKSFSMDLLYQGVISEYLFGKERQANEYTCTFAFAYSF